MLKRGIEVLVGAALVVVLLAVLPAVAQAQSGAGAAPTRVVVSPGDTLWTISKEHLGPRATPRQIVGMVEQIYALNRDRIGPDPNLIFVGQELSLPAPAGGPSAAPAGTAARGAHTMKGKSEPADQPEQRVLLPKAPASVAAPAIGSLATDAPLTTSSAVASFAENVRSAVTSASAVLAGTSAEVRAAYEGRQLLGGGIIALTLFVGALMAWKLPMKRGIGESEKWGTYPDYRGAYYRDYPPSYPRGYAETEKRPSPVGGLGVIAQKRKQLTTRRGSKRSPRRWSAAEAHSVDVRRFSRRAVLRARPRKPRDTRVKTARRLAVQRIARGGR